MKISKYTFFFNIDGKEYYTYNTHYQILCWKSTKNLIVYFKITKPVSKNYRPRRSTKNYGMSCARTTF